MMRMYKCLVLTYPGNLMMMFRLFLVIFCFALPLKAQNGSIYIPYKESSQLLLNQSDPSGWDLQVFNQEIQDIERKSPSRAFFYSLLLPGTGEAYVGEKLQSKIFLGIEITAWGLIVANMINVHVRQSDYKNYAVQHAFVNRTGKNDQYWIDIGKYNNIFEYNEQRRRDRDVDAIYEENEYYAWAWDQTENRFYYDGYRIETREIERRRIYFFGALALNRLVSAINALRLANSHNRKIEELSFNLNFDYNPIHNQFLFSLQKSF